METVGVFFGSRSPEHDISIITAQLIISGLKGLGTDVVPVYLDKKGKWFIGSALGELAFFQKGIGDLEKSGLGKYSINLEKSIGRMVFQKQGIIPKAEIAIDIAFPAFHGSYGEDGTIQGLFEMFDIPYVGCDVASSSIAMDKVLTKQFYRQYNFPTTDFLFFQYQEWNDSKRRILELISKTLTYPVFIKPARLGSSIGISKVKSRKDLESGIDVAFHYDEKVIIEESVENLMDLTCCIIGNENPIASKLQESVFQSSFFSFEDKYLKKGGAQLGKAKNNIIIPARISTTLTEKIRETARSIYKNLGCSGIARIDFLYNRRTGRFFANEMNPLPGTLYHHLWKASGIAFNDLLMNLLDFAKDRYRQKKRVTYVFQSSILQQTGGQKMSLGSKLAQ